MTDDVYSVKINRREGVVEIVGSDSAWVAEQLDKLSPVFTDAIDDGGGADESPSDRGSGGGSGKSRRTTARRRARTGVTPAASGPDLEEKLTEPLQKKLEQFKAKREANFTSRQQQAAIIAYFLEDEAGFSDGISAEDLGAVYEVMGWRAPVNPRAVINNARDRNGYFRGWVGGRAKLSVAGRNFARHDALKSPEGDDA
jgi:hypothetical protein